MRRSRLPHWGEDLAKDEEEEINDENNDEKKQDGEGVALGPDPEIFPDSKVQETTVK